MNGSYLLFLLQILIWYENVYDVCTCTMHMYIENCLTYTRYLVAYDCGLGCHSEGRAAPGRVNNDLPTPTTVGSAGRIQCQLCPILVVEMMLLCRRLCLNGWLGFRVRRAFKKIQILKCS